MFSPPTLQTWNDPAFEKLQLKVEILRLDLLHPTISGNKWLKLRGYIQQAKKAKMAGILTKGGPWSNHAHAVAYACHTMNLTCELWIKGHQKQVTATLQDCLAWQANITFINRTLFYDEAAATTLARENNLLYVPLGGADETGITSVAAYLNELELLPYSHVCCSVGTATTFAGLAFSQQAFAHIIGIESGTKDPALPEKIKLWQQQLPKQKLSLVHDYAFGGYSKYNNELLTFMNQLYEQQKIPTDIVYTGKLFYALKDLATKGLFAPADRILVIHSGGLQGNRSLPVSILQF